MTSVKRRIVAFVGAALMAGTMAMGVSAYTKHYPFNSIQGDIQGNPETVSASTNATYGSMVAYTNRTKMTTSTTGSNLGYDYHYKIARYFVFGYENGGFEEIPRSNAQKEAVGTSKAILTSIYTPNNQCVRRVQTGRIYNSGSSGSTLKEFHYCRITKVGAGS